MAHPLALEFEQIARPIALSLGLEVVHVVFQTNQRPPVMRVDIRNPRTADTSHDDCEAMSRAIGIQLAESDPIPGAYVLEVSSPGLSSLLQDDRDFESFKGFGVEVELLSPVKGRQQWTGHLQRRDDRHLWLSCKGKPIKLPREAIAQVKLLDGEPP